MKIEFNINDLEVAAKMKKVVFLDVETSMVTARIFQTGQQYININQLQDRTKLLTASWGTMYDLATLGSAGVKAVGNHMGPNFKDNPMDDLYVLKQLWTVLDEADTICCHNAKFDVGMMQGRFLEAGLPLPSPYKVVCTYKGLSGFSMNSKKLDSLSQILVGSKKISTSHSLWHRCADGEEEAFKEMMAYNIGDIYDTLYQVYIRTAAYYPKKAVDLSVPGRLCCKVSGQPLVGAGTWINPNNGNEYSMYINPTLNIYYRDRYKREAKKAGKGFLIPL